MGGAAGLGPRRLYLLATSWPHFVDSSVLEASCENRPPGVDFVQFREYFLTRISETKTAENNNSLFGILLIGVAQDHAFDELKRLLTSAPLLALPDFNKQFEIECDASGIGIGGVLMQEGRPIAYFSEKLSGAKLNYPIYDKELYALIRVLEESHAGGLMGHFGREKTLLMLADHFYWPKMRRDVDRYVKRCITCNKSKSKLKPHVHELLLEDTLGKAWDKVLFSTTCHPQTDGQTEVVNRTLSQLLRSMIKKNLKEWEECLPHVEFAYNRAVHSTTELCPFEVVYGFKPITPLDLLPLPIHERVNMEASKRADFVRKIHVKTKELIEKKGKSNAARMNKKRKEMLFKPGDMVWVHFRKDKFSKLRKSKLKPRGAGPYKVLAKINDNAYQEETSIARGGEEHLDMKTDVKMDDGRSRWPGKGPPRSWAPRPGKGPPRWSNKGPTVTVTCILLVFVRERCFEFLLASTTTHSASSGYRQVRRVVDGHELAHLQLWEASCNFCRWSVEVLFDGQGKMYPHTGWGQVRRDLHLEPASSPSL
ncbi:hypothetical protein QYE76_028755 [Lolium multiflorum]|uniref:Integrase catalytic domain-containing protein n=1 Tax=Lolium multiflorum TaxID=4521 RepID=A0AAD8QP75_LOLMU|nr:hypothetical protein QYE76_028755 [Lolium multiflorum]